jgi:hypothetical protein
MKKPSQSFQKRKREMDRKQKKEEKRQRKLERKLAKAEESSGPTEKDEDVEVTENAS